MQKLLLLSIKINVHYNLLKLLKNAKVVNYRQSYEASIKLQ